MNMVCGQVLKYAVMMLAFLNNIVIGDSQGSCHCIRLKECSTFIILIRTLDEPMKSSFIDYLRTKQCDQHQKYPKVCCPDQTKVEQKVSTSTTSIPSTTKSSNTQPCHDISKCIVLKDCTPYMSFIKSTGSPLSRSLVHFLRSQECGFQDGMPKVCCAALPTSFQALKHAGPEPRRPFKKLTAEEEETTTRRATRAPARHLVNQFRQQFAGFRDEVMATDFFDYTESFDLALRRKRFDNDSFMDIEIR